MIAILLNTLKTFQKTLKKSNILKLLLVYAISLVVCSIGFYHFESAANPELDFGDALWWGLVTTTTVGYGDYFPVTLFGRITGTFLMLIGISTFGFITAVAVAAFVEKKMKEGMGLMDIKFNPDIVIIGWNDKSKIILDELCLDNPEKKIVIIDDIERLLLDNKNVYFVHGDPTKDETLSKANVKNAHTVIVVADASLENHGMADAKSVLICLAVDNLNTDIHLISEVLQKENIPHFKRANVNDLIVSDEMSSRIIVRSALYKNVSNTLKELLTGTYGNELYEIPVRKDDVGMTFKELAAKYMESHNCILLGIANDELHLNPDKNKVIEKDDVIIYVSHDRL